MQLIELREPVNAWSHGAGMVLALPVTWLLLKRCAALQTAGAIQRSYAPTQYQRSKAISLVAYGLSLVACYGSSAVFHAVRCGSEALGWLQRLDHVGIYLLIAGTYTPIAAGLMRSGWSWGTLTTIWSITAVCAARVWWGSPIPVWISTSIYLAMGWGAMICYRELARTHSPRTLLLLPLGGVFYSAGALINLARWPVLCPGVFASHEVFHFFVIAGSATHVLFMLKVVVPASESPLLAPRRTSSLPTQETVESRISSNTGYRHPRLGLRIRCLGDVLAQGHRFVARDKLDPLPAENAIEAV
jgi:hemolysin III